MGYTFGGWDKEFDNITSDLVVIAIYIPSSVGDLNDLILAATDRERPDYTIDIVEWNTYWGGVQSKLAAAETVYNQLKGKEVLTPEEETQLGNAKHELQIAMEIIDGIGTLTQPLAIGHSQESPRKIRCDSQGEGCY